MSSESSLSSVLTHAAVASVSAGLTVYLLLKVLRKDSLEEARKSLPRRIILLRHGQSMGNVDLGLYRTCPDNQVELTEEGRGQAWAAGKRIRELVGDEKLDLYVSPFQRTLQTSRNVIQAFEPGQVNHVTIDPRIREQEFGNLQGDDFKTFRQEQKKVGRFWYRFPTGESGGDVYDRIAQWWETEMMFHNQRPLREKVDNVLVVTHGLTMRLIMMQLFGWSPDTFHTVWNAGNCSLYVLKYDASLPRRAPYRLDPQEGDMPESTKTIGVRLNTGEQVECLLKDYLSIPQPRTEHPEVVKGMLKKQHGMCPEDIKHIDFFYCPEKQLLAPSGTSPSGTRNMTPIISTGSRM